MRRRGGRRLRTALVALAAGSVLAACAAGLAAAQAEDPGRPIVVASKPFGESYILAEMFAQLLESAGHRVDRRPGLGATEIAFQALRTGAIDVYPEYTGTGLLAILKEEARSDPRDTFRHVAREFERRFGVRWLPPLGFQNTYAIAVRRDTADRYRLRTLSDLRGAAPELTAGFTPDFIGRPDGLPGLGAAYGLEFRDVRSLLQAVKYQAVAEGGVDVIDGYSTDGLLARYDLVVLEDDRKFFPPYEAAALVGDRLARDNAAAVAALTRLSGRIDEGAMRELNRQLEVDGRPVAEVAATGLQMIGLRAAPDDDHVDRKGDGPQRDSLARYLWAGRARTFALTLRHLALVALSLVAAILVAVPVGVLLERARGGAEPAIRVAGLLQTIPGIALLAFMLPFLGIGTVPALVALFLYSLYPILRNTYTGVRDAAPDAVAAGRAMGMTPRQVLAHIRFPLAAPVIMAGIRTAAVINVGTATLAAFIGAGGLGDPIVAGLALSDSRMILSGAIPAAVLALAIDGVLAVAERGVRPSVGLH